MIVNKITLLISTPNNTAISDEDIKEAVSEFDSNYAVEIIGNEEIFKS